MEPTPDSILSVGRLVSCCATRLIMQPWKMSDLEKCAVLLNALYRCAAAAVFHVNGQYRIGSVPDPCFFKLVNKHPCRVNYVENVLCRKPQYGSIDFIASFLLLLLFFLFPSPLMVVYCLYLVIGMCQLTATVHTVPLCTLTPHDFEVASEPAGVVPLKRGTPILCCLHRGVVRNPRARQEHTVFLHT